MKSDGQDYEDEHSKPHLMYHRERKGSNPSPSPHPNRTEPCAASGGSSTSGLFERHSKGSPPP